MEYAERLHVPLRWWVQGTMLVASLWLALVVALPESLAWTVTAVALAVMIAGYQALAAKIVVTHGDLRAGRARIPLHHLGAVQVLDADQTRRVTGVDADARAYLLIRPYLKRSIKVTITDPADPTPYWLMHTRNPERLAQVLADRQVPAQRMPDPSAG